MNTGTVHQLSFYSKHLEKEKKLYIYLPPSYSLNEDLHYSCVYTLPGLMDYEASWCDNGRLHEAMDTLLYHQSLGEMIVVMPDKDDAAISSDDEFYFAHYIATDLVEFIEENFRVIPSAGHRAIEGLSLGASWAFRLAAHLPGRYRSVGVLSTAFSEEDYQVLEQNADALHRAGTRFFLSAGTGEAHIIPSNQQFTQYMQNMGFDAYLNIEEGPHDWPLWQNVIYKSLPFHFASFNS